MDPVFPENDDNWPNNQSSKFSPYEQECIDYIDSLPNLSETNNNNSDDEFANEKLNYERKLWTYFQSSATAIAQLYSRDNLLTAHNVWNTFQQASTNVTCLYKESTEYHKKNYDLYHQSGYNKRSKEILNWIKKKKTLIRRDELLAFLSGHNNNNHPNYLHNNNSYCFHHRFSGRNSRSNRNITNNISTSLPNNNDEINLDTFKEALNSNIKNSAVQLINNTAVNKRNNSWLDAGDGLNEFIDQQYHRHVESRKRPSSMDICMDSSIINTNNKRTKFC